MNHRRIAAVTLCMLLPLGLCGCELFAFVAGKGEQKAQYTLPPGKRVLVFVDMRPGVGAPAQFTTQLAEKIGDHLYKYQAADRIVEQSRLIALRRETDTFSKLGVADIARATESDVVLHVDLITYDVSSLSDDTVTQGEAQGLVKVVGANGERLWPPAAVAGAGVLAKIDPALSDQRDVRAVERGLIDLLALRIGRAFHAYSLDDAQMTK